jgi:hypothetical protein
LSRPVARLNAISRYEQNPTRWSISSLASSFVKDSVDQLWETASLWPNDPGDFQMIPLKYPAVEPKNGKTSDALKAP